MVPSTSSALKTLLSVQATPESRHAQEPRKTRTSIRAAWDGDKSIKLGAGLLGLGPWLQAAARPLWASQNHLGGALAALSLGLWWYQNDSMFPL